MSGIRFLDEVERSSSLESALQAGEWRWTIFERPTRTFYVGSRDTKTHMTVAAEAGVLAHPTDYYRPGPRAQVLGGYLVRVADDRFVFDPYSGTFPGTNEAVEEASATLREVCRAEGLAWKAFELSDRPAESS